MIKEQEVTAAHRDEILRLPNVMGIFTGEKVTGGKPTGQTAVVVSVRKKQDVPEKDRVPVELDGVPTDVIEEEEFFAFADTNRYNPLQGGISIGPIGSGIYGTLGMVVTDNSTGSPMGLSNYHVFYAVDMYHTGYPYTQPSMSDGGVIGPDSILTVARGTLGGTIDAAVAYILPDRRDATNTIVDIGEITGTGTATVGMPVSKRGRTTLLTSGSVIATDYSGYIGYHPPLPSSVLYTDLIRFEGPPGTMLPGDSGSMLMTAGGVIVGLAFAGNPDGTVCFACHISAVFSAMDVGLYVPPPSVALHLMAPSTYMAGFDQEIKRETLSDDLADWEIVGSVELVNNTSYVVVGVGNPDSLTDRTAYFVGFRGSERLADDSAFDLSTPTSYAEAGDASFLPDVPIGFRLSWDHDSRTLACTACQDGPGQFSVDLLLSGTPGMALPYYFVVEGGSSDSSGSAVKIHDLSVSHNCGSSGGVIITEGHWTIDRGTIFISLDSWDISGFVDDSTPGEASSAQHTLVVDTSAPWTLEATLRRDAPFEGTPAELFFGFSHAEGYLADVGVFIVEPDMYLYAGPGSYDPWYVPAPPAETDVRMRMEWIPSTLSLVWSLTWDPDVSVSYTNTVTLPFPSPMHLGFWMSWGGGSATDIVLTATTI
jgi:hypothetical protein